MLLLTKASVDFIWSVIDYLGAFYTDIVDIYQVTQNKRFYIERLLIPCRI